MTEESIIADLNAFIEASAAGDGSAAPVKPAHRIPFHWPPHPVSLDYHVLPSDWTGKARLEAHGEVFDVSVAKTAFGVFGRADKFWNEARGSTEEEMLENLREGTEPLFSRQFAIAKALGRDGRFDCLIRSLGPVELLRLLYCEDRDVSSEARVEIEKQASLGVFLPALIRILRDETHPHRRSAQWCVLDMFEDLPAFARSDEAQQAAIDAIHDLMWSATDDYARTIYKAGVVLGGHVCTDAAADALISCIAAPSKYGRRSAMHAVFHLVEWMPERREQAAEALRRQIAVEPEPMLQKFAECMAADIEEDNVEHVTEPLFTEELQA
jgi:hypothetical protein